MARSKRQYPPYTNHSKKWKLVSETRVEKKKSIKASDKRKRKKRLFDNREIVPCCFCQCFLDMATATIEHVTPLSYGGSWNIRNLEISCYQCNQERGTQNFVYFLQKKKLIINKEINRIGSL